MGRIYRTNVFTGQGEWVDFEPGVMRFGSSDEPRRAGISYSKGLVSQGAACHPSQVQEFNEYYRKHGIRSAYHRDNGDLVYESKKAFNDVLKSRNLFNRDAGYGDWAGNNNSTPTRVDTLAELQKAAKSDPEFRCRVEQVLEKHRSR